MYTDFTMGNWCSEYCLKGWRSRLSEMSPRIILPNWTVKETTTTVPTHQDDGESGLHKGTFWYTTVATIQKFRRYCHSKYSKQMTVLWKAGAENTWILIMPTSRKTKEQKKAFCLIFTFQILLKCIQLTNHLPLEL